MKRTLFVMAVVLSFATAAGAATLTVVSDKLTYNVGETITLTVTGNGGGATAYSLLGRLLYNSSLASGQTQTQQLAGTGWIAGTLVTGAGFSESFNQIDGTFLGNTCCAANPLSTVTLLANAPGTVNLSWFDNLSFFDIAGAQSANASFTIAGVPEPTTAAMLGLGLIGLAFGGRRRS